jgi:hypothetical protein
MAEHKLYLIIKNFTEEPELITKCKSQFIKFFGKTDKRIIDTWFGGKTSSFGFYNGFWLQRHTIPKIKGIGTGNRGSFIKSK